MNLGNWLHHLWVSDTVADEAVAQCVEHAVDLIEPRMRIESAYAHRLREPVSRLLACAEGFATEVPGPLTLDRHGFGAEPLVHALFASVGDIPRTVNLSVELRDYIASGAGAQGGLFAMLGVRRMEKSVFGMALEGEVLRREVAQVAVYFRAHTYAGPAPTEAQARKRLARRAFESVVLGLADRVAALREQRAQLEAENNMLRARRRAANDNAILRAKSLKAATRLRELVESLQPAAILDDTARQLSDPGRYLRLEKVSLTLSRLGIKLDEHSTEPGERIAFPELVGRDRRRWAVLLVHVPSEVLAEAASLAAQAQRWITI